MSTRFDRLITALASFGFRTAGYTPLVEEPSDLYLSSTSSDNSSHPPFPAEHSSVSTDGTAPGSPAIKPVSPLLLKALSASSSFSLSSSDEDEETEPVSELPQKGAILDFYKRKSILRHTASERAKENYHPQDHVIAAAKQALTRFLVTSHPTSYESHEHRVKACALSVIPAALSTALRVSRGSPQSKIVTLATRSTVIALERQLVLSEEHLKDLEVLVKQSIVLTLNPPAPPPTPAAPPRPAASAPKSIAASVMPPPPPRGVSLPKGGAGARGSFTSWSAT